MFEKNTGDQEKPTDRRLGDEWTDWDGDAAELEIDESPAVFCWLAAGVLFILTSLLPVAWYLIKPRIELWNAFAAKLLEDSLQGFIALFILVSLAEGISLLNFGKSLLPFVWAEKFLLFLLPKVLWLGAKFRISRDRIGNSFIKVHNLLIKCSPHIVNPEKVLVLLPRCLKKEARTQLMERMNGDTFKVLTVGGGEQAREAIKQHRPTFILALACERDLLSGIKDVAEKVPVLAIPNKRPEGPCKNTHVSTADLEEALSLLRKARK